MNTKNDENLPLDEVKKEETTVEQLKKIENKDKENWDKISSIIWFFFSMLTLILLLLKIFVFQQVNVVGNSMMPNFEWKEKLLVNKLQKDIKRGDVVSVYEFANMADDANILTKAFPILSKHSPRFLLKRVIAMPGEGIEIMGSKVIIYNAQNPEGAVLREDYIPSYIKEKMDNGCGRNTQYFPKKILQQDEYFVMGDNRCDSLDSRASDHGAYKKELIFGNIVYVYWPLEKIKKVELPHYSFEKIDLKTREEIEKYQITR